MAKHTVTIKRDGSCVPSRLGNIVPGQDTVSFVCETENTAVISIDRSDVFGVDRFEVPAGAKKDLSVSSTASAGNFAYRYEGDGRGGMVPRGGADGDGTVIGGPGLESGDGSVVGGPD